MLSLAKILEQGLLSAVFQPVMDLHAGGFFGFEGLIRGPVDSALMMPMALFAEARQQNLSLQLEMLSRRVVMEAFARQNLPGKLFLNVSPETLRHPDFKYGQTLACLEKLGLDPKRVIIEITESQPTRDFEAMRQALLHYRSMGFQIAIDDLGEGFSSLRLWSELRPDFVKVDQHFVQGINNDPVKKQFLKSIHNIAQRTGTQVIAEGVETEAEFNVLREMGIACGQGYFIANPCHTPPLQPALELNVSERIKSSSNLQQAQILAHYVEPLSPDSPLSLVLQRFEGSPALKAIPVVKQGRVVGLIRRHLVQSAALFLPSDQLCSSVMHSNPLLVDQATSLAELNAFLAHASRDYFHQGFVITHQGCYVGMADGFSLLQELGHQQRDSERQTNILTRLPGSAQVVSHIQHLLKSQANFAVCYADVNGLKAYNREFGYHKGDELLRLVAQVLSNVCDPVLDFIAHIAEDDFVLVMQSKQWDSRCNQALNTLMTSSGLLSVTRQVIAGYMKDGLRNRMFSLEQPTLAMGAMWIQGGHFESALEVLDMAKEAHAVAKRLPENQLYIKQRRNPQQRTTPDYV